jgi:hypothetical protein
MTTPDETQDEDDTTGRAGNTGALAAASQEPEEAGDPLGPLNRVTEDEDE